MTQYGGQFCTPNNIPIGRLATFRRKIDVSGSTVNGFGRAKTAGLPAVFFEGLW
jgi:hypothetical protein